MKKIFVLLTVCALPILASAAAFSAAPTATQAYHATSYTSDSTPETATAPAATTSDETSGAAIVATPQASLSSQDQTNQRLQNLEDSNRAIGRALFTLNQNVAILQAQQMDHPSRKSTIDNFFLSHDDYLTLSLAAVSLLLMGMMMGRLMRRNPAVTANNGHEKSEYDFMGTNEAIPAKLDLARSYIAMGNHHDAKMELKIVVQKGNEEQKMIAEALLHKINKAKI
ncbi:MAG: hypothetical protein NTZ67_05845 [Gammaproteobacteria bacterium]|nr:hypothetical protein [Gammaproteobacteria bacterium]